jgi:phytoene dehydrogenase-like protein
LRGSLQRPGNAARGVKGLHLAGGTVHPGGGLPLVALGARLVAEAIGPAD